ncbi:hypothetical protein SAY86_019372 [Trapa natans]|uniref:BTB domain-containing protein n=1 Tax=Trapa natans TaxID=22666 RepID=A0AAN7LH53_TRANT|nr:hypothetical protein SAY86_019372 [Trapa natans]
MQVRFFKLLDLFKSTQVHAINPLTSETSSGEAPGATSGRGGSKLNNHLLKLIGSRPKTHNSVSLAESLLLAYGLPNAQLIEPPIEPFLKPISLVETLSDIYHRLQGCTPQDRPLICMEQYSILRSLGDPKLLRRCLRDAHVFASDLHSKLVLYAWLRFEQREDEPAGLSPAADSSIDELNFGCGTNSTSDDCNLSVNQRSSVIVDGVEDSIVVGQDSAVLFYIGHEEVRCLRSKIASLSFPFRTMLYGSFVESKRESVDFSCNGISAKAMQAVELYSRTKRLDSFDPEIVMEMLSFANRFCCEEMKSACDAHLALHVKSVEDVLTLMDYGLEEMAHLLVASCLQVLLRELPHSLHIPQVEKLLCSSEARERLVMIGHSSFLLYYFLSQVALGESMTSNMTLMLLERLNECATEKWQQVIVLHQLGCVRLQREEFEEALRCFENANELGHTYSVAGIARVRYKQGQRYSAYKMISSLINESSKPTGWMFQERSLYGIARDKISDANTATKLDPTLSFPYKLRVVLKVEENQIQAAILEIDRLIRFKLSTDSLELRAWLSIAAEDYKSAIRDVRALLTLEPNYMLFNGKVSGKNLVGFLSCQIEQCSQADCWMQLYDRWSSVDDIGSLAVIHHMLANDPQKSLLWFRQSLLLLRLNCQKAAMRSLRLARNYSTAEHERLVYEGWILYDTGNREEALSRVEKSISLQRSFEAFFLKAYVLADATLDSQASSYVIDLLEEALKCPSDGLRKGQALNNLASIYVDCGKLELAERCYKNALDIRHTRAHQGLARVYHLKNQRAAAHYEMTQLIDKAQYKASAYEKRSEYSDRESAQNDLNMATQLDPLRTYPYRYRAAVLMDDQKEAEAVEELTRAIEFKPDLQMLHLRAAFHESMGNLSLALQDCKAALCLDPIHVDTLDLYQRACCRATEQPR